VNITTVRALVVVVLSSLLGASSTIAATLPTDTKENVLKSCYNMCAKHLVPDTNDKILTSPIRVHCGHECGSEENVRNLCNYAKGETYKDKCAIAASRV